MQKTKRLQTDLELQQNEIKRFDPKKLFREATAKMNNVQSQKYGYPFEVIEENAVKSEKF